MIKHYDCRNAIEPIIDGHSYLEEYELAKNEFESADILFSNKKYRGAFVQLMIGLQDMGQAVLIYKFKSRTKSKMCQFKYLYEKGLLDDEDIDLLGDLITKRNDLYYNNPGTNSHIDKEEYENLHNKVILLVEKLEVLL